MSGSQTAATVDELGGPGPVSTTPKGRPVLAIVCLVLAALLTTPAVVAFWGQRTVNDAERFVATVGPLIDSPEVQDAIATKVTNAIQEQVDIEEIINSVFAGVITDAPRLEQLVVPLSAAINGLIDRQVREFIASDAFADIWVTVTTRVQQGLVRLLDGDETGAISTQGDQVVLDVGEVIDQVKQRLVDRGLTILANVPIPDVDRQIVLLDSSQLQQVRTIYGFTHPIARWLIVVVAGLYLAAFFLARRRPRATVAIGVAIALNSIVMALALSVGKQAFINALAGTEFGPASTAFYNQLLSYLERSQDVLLWVGLILVVVGWFSGPNTAGTAVRTAVVDGLESVGAALPGEPVANVGRWVAANAAWLRVVVGVLGFVVLLWGNDVSQSRVFWSATFVVVLLGVIQVLIGAGREKTVDALPQPAV